MYTTILKTKYYPNTKIFQELYPEGREEDSKWAVDYWEKIKIEDSVSAMTNLFKQAYANSISQLVPKKGKCVKIV